MIEQTVKIVAVKDSTVWVESLSRHGCSRCETGQGCGGGIFAKLFGDKQYKMEIARTLPVEEGDNVVIGIPENSVTTAAIWTYLFPLIGLFLGAIVGDNIDSVGEELWTLSFSIVGFSAVLLLRVLKVKTRQFKEKYTPRMLYKDGK